MKLSPEQLHRHLQNDLKPVYLLSGDEPLLIQEAAAAIRQKGRERGFTEREILHAESGFQWELLLEKANSLSLFADRTLIELHIPNGKPGPRGTDILTHYLNSPSPDTLLLVYTPRLDAGAQKSKWFKAIDQCGATLAFWPVELSQLPRWIGERFAAAGLSANSETCQLLADRVEGNLLAATQEIEKLKLQVTDNLVTEDLIIGGVADSARYDVYALTEAALAGQVDRALRVLTGVRAEGTDATLVVWALARELRTLLDLSLECRGQPPSEAQCRKHRLWGKRKTLVSRALPRLKPKTLEPLIQRCAQADQAIKGMRQESAWDLTAQLLIDLGTAR